MGDANKRKPYLPAEKQYLITRNGTLTDHSSLFSQLGAQECSLGLLFTFILITDFP